MNRRFRTSVFWLKPIACMLLAASAKAFAVDIYATTSGGIFARFDSASPGSLDLSLITGIGAGETVIGMDFRPSIQKLYLITNASGVGHLYTVDPNTAAATPVATLATDPADTIDPFTSLSGTHFGVNFNPVSDRLRVVSDNGMNIRVNPVNGFVTTDTALNPGSPHVVAVAYINSYPGDISTSLYDIDSATDTVITQNPPNNGTLITIGALGVDTSNIVGFEIVWLGSSNSAYATLSVGGTVGLYSINLVSGAATLIGNVGGNPSVIAIAIDQDRIFHNGFE